MNCTRKMRLSTSSLTRDISDVSAMTPFCDVTASMVLLVCACAIDLFVEVVAFLSSETDETMESHIKMDIKMNFTLHIYMSSSNKELIYFSRFDS